MAVKQSNEALVLFTLAIAETPLTINQIVTRSNKSYNTVKSVVLADERIAKVTEYPARYHLGKPEVKNLKKVGSSGCPKCHLNSPTLFG
jgi:hypothetical protein